jgi:ABC-type branched-subunit amino acid transport system ATPase component
MLIESLSVKYGGVPAPHGVSMDVMEGELVTLIGANGAGKSTFLKAISRWRDTRVKSRSMGDPLITAAHDPF